MKWVNTISPDAVFVAQCLAGAAKVEREEKGKIICPL